MPTIFTRETITVWKFRPQPDITAYELAQCLIYLDRSAWHQMPMTAEIVRFPKSADFAEEIARHFEQVDERQVEVPHVQDTRIWDEDRMDLTEAEMHLAMKGLDDLSLEKLATVLEPDMAGEALAARVEEGLPTEDAEDLDAPV